MLARPEDRLGQFRADLLGTFLSFDSRYAFGDVKLLLGRRETGRAYIFISEQTRDDTLQVRAFCGCLLAGMDRDRSLAKLYM